MFFTRPWRLQQEPQRINPSLPSHLPELGADHNFKTEKMVLSQYTTYLAESLCGGSSRKLIAGWWYVWKESAKRGALFLVVERSFAEFSMSIRPHHPNTHQLILTTHTLQVFHPRHDGIVNNTRNSRFGIKEVSGRPCRGMVRPHVVRPFRWWNHDYEKISFVACRGVFYGMCCGHESNVFHVVSGVSVSTLCSVFFLVFCAD